MGEQCCDCYSRFLKSLRKPDLKICSCPSRLHPGPWVPPPCLTSKPKSKVSNPRRLSQKRNSRRMSFSSPDLSDVNKDSTDSDRNHNLSRIATQDLILALEDMQQEQQILQNALIKCDRGENIPESVQKVIYKWKKNEVPVLQNVGRGSRSPKKETNLSKNEKAVLKGLVKSSMKLSRREKHFHSADGVPSLPVEKRKPKAGEEEDVEISLSTQYLSLERKYEELLNNMLQLEAEKEFLRKENKELHSVVNEETKSFLKERILTLQKKVENMSGIMYEYEGLQEEAELLRAQNDQLKSEVGKFQRAMETLSMEKEVDLVKKLNATKLFYDKAIDGYKNELELCNKELGSMRERAKEKMEKIILEKDKEIELLKQSAKNVDGLYLKGDLEERLLGKLEETLLQVGTGNIEHLKLILKELLENWQVEIFQKMKEVNGHYTREQQKEVDNSKIAASLEAFREFPELIKNSTMKLEGMEESIQKEINNRLLEERLQRMKDEMKSKDEQLKSSQEKLCNLAERIRLLEKKVAADEGKIEKLQLSISRKDDILDRNSAQLEEQIRASVDFSSQIEKLREEHNRELETLKERYGKQDLFSSSKVAELEMEIEKLDSQLSHLKNEKANQEREYKRLIKAQEDQLDHLTFRNNTLQRQLETISTTYKTLFASSDSKS